MLVFTCRREFLKFFHFHLAVLVKNRLTVRAEHFVLASLIVQTVCAQGRALHTKSYGSVEILAEFLVEAYIAGEY